MSQSPVHPQGSPPWSPLDEYLWHTCDILADVSQGNSARRPLVATTAPLRSGDRALVAGPALKSTWRALGNGRYQHNQVVAFGRPSFVIGSQLGAAIGNASRRREAARNARPRWVSDGTGEVTVALKGAYFVHPTNPNGSAHLYWSGLSQIDLVAPDVFQTHYVSVANNPITVRLHTPWASLIFAMAAYCNFPSHPRLLTRGWLPPGFEERCAALGRPCPPAARLVLGHQAP
ncbi:hypothetical protein [Streptomyces sp. NPDC057426]|uniref:hypothetical protein n=1 Tax=Streptomyces sp. NPDC057426 TaxID=3346128 RepID=UPI003694C328